jgi:hypothetical protein
MYRGRVRPVGLAFYQPRDVAAVEARLRSSALGGVLHGPVSLADEDYLVYLRLSEDPSADEVGSVAETLEALGYQWLNGEVVSYATRAVEGGVLCFLGGGTAGSRAGDAVSVMAAVVAGLVGLWIGSRITRYEPIYSVQRTWQGWQLVPVANS